MTILAITRAELQQRRQMVLLAAVCGVASALLRLLPPPPHGGDVTWATAPFVGGTMLMAMGIVGIPPALALGLGSSVFAREVAERRLGFWFGRPVSAAQLFAGKAAASALLVVSTLALALVPNLLTDRVASTGGPTAALVTLFTQAWSWMIPAGLVALFALFNVIALSVRGGSRLAAVDTMVLAAGAGSVLYVGRSLHDAAAMLALRDLIGGAIAFLALAPLAAGFAWLAAGRCDAERGHRALALTLAVATLAGVATAFAFERHVLGAAPSDLRAWPVTVASVSPDGTHAVVGGRTDRGRLSHVATFLVDLRDGRWERLGIVTGVAWSPHGGSAIFVGDRGELMRATLDSAGVTLERTQGLGVRADAAFVDGSSASGRLVAVRLASDVVLVRTDAWKAAGRAPLDGRCATAFAGETLRIACATPLRGGTVRVVVTDLDEQQRRDVAQLERPALQCRPQLEDGARRLLLACAPPAPSPGTLELLDAVSGQRTALLSEGHDTGWPTMFLRDGRVARANGRTRELTVWTGEQPRRLSLPGERMLAGEAGAGFLVMGPLPGRTDATLLVDVDRGTVTPEPDLLPLDGERLFRARDGALVMRDPATGARRVVIPGRRS